MNKKVLVSILLGLISVATATVLFVRLHSKNKEVNTVVRAEKEIREKLNILRDFEVAYLKKYKIYAPSFDILKDFIETDIFYIVERKEEIITLYYGADSIAVTYDTLGTVNVRDSLFNQNKSKGYTLTNLGLAPETKLPFTFYAEQTDGRNLFEIADPKPLNPKRQNGVLPPLQIGSRLSATTKGNWEK